MAGLKKKLIANTDIIILFIKIEKIEMVILMKEYQFIKKYLVKYIFEKKLKVNLYS